VLVAKDGAVPVEERDNMSGSGFLGTRASWAADLNLIAQVVLLLILVAGILRAKKPDFASHHSWMTAVVLANAALIVAIMNPSFFRALPLALVDAAIKPKIVLPHFVVGVLAELMGLYAVIAVRMDLPETWRLHNTKRFMQITAMLWTIALVGGIVLYVVWYI
jgi:uncharacterized membrane protein YozB (DUF420 family)